MLYQRNWLRIIADINAKPVPLASTATHSAALLDLSTSVAAFGVTDPYRISAEHGRRRLDVGVDPARRQIVGPVRLPPLFAAAHLVRAAYRRRTVRPDVFLDPGNPRARGDHRLRDARAPDPGAADRGRRRPRPQPARHRRLHRRLPQDDRCDGIAIWSDGRDHAVGRDPDRARGQGSRRLHQPHLAGTDLRQRRDRQGLRIAANRSATAPPASSPFRSRARRATA